jgi:hypothetical protein
LEDQVEWEEAGGGLYLDSYRGEELAVVQEQVTRMLGGNEFKRGIERRVPNECEDR